MRSAGTCSAFANAFAVSPEGARKSSRNTSPVLVHDLDVLRPRMSPTKANTPLVVDTEAVLALPTRLECFQAIARWGTQESKRRRRFSPLRNHAGVGQGEWTGAQFYGNMGK